MPCPDQVIRRGKQRVCHDAEHIVVLIGKNFYRRAESIILPDSYEELAAFAPLTEHSPKIKAAYVSTNRDSNPISSKFHTEYQQHYHGICTSSATAYSEGRNKVSK